MLKLRILSCLVGAVLICITNFSFAQSDCPVVGWASQNGGVTGGGAVTATVVTNYNDLKTAITSTAVKVIHISGAITVPSGGRLSFKDQSGKTIYGLPGSKLVSSDQSADNSGILYVRNCSNIIFKNLTFEGPGAYDADGWDNMTLDNCTNIWIDHCEFQDGMDGNFDIKNSSDYITATWCKFIYNKAPRAGGPGGADDHRFSDLFGSSDGTTTDRGKLRVTMQYCWWAQGCKARMPRVRFGKVHLANNLFNSTVAAQCIQAGFEADLLVESNVFENVNRPIDLMDNNFTAVTEKNNKFLSTTGSKAGSGTAFTPPYTLDVTLVDNVKDTVMTNAGATLTSASCDVATPTTYTLSTTATPTAGGTITGAGTYTSGTVVTVKATPATGYTFTGWSGDASGTAASITVTMSSNKSVTANFQATYTLSTTATPAAGGTIIGAGTYPSGTLVTVKATPATGYTFTGWSGDASGTAASITVTMSGNKSVTANFQADAVTPTNYTLSTTATPTAGGTITGAGTYTSGTLVTVKATPATGYTFTGWSGDASGTDASITVTMSGNKSVTANFQADAVAPTNYILSTTATPTAGGTITGAGTYTSGTVVTVKATPATGYTFTGWSGDASGTAASVTVTMNGNKSATANFQADAVTPTNYTLSTTAAPTAGGTITGEGTYTSGTVVTVKATPATGYTFTGWSGDASGTDASINVTMSGNKSVTANFQEQVIEPVTYTLSTTSIPTGGGTILGAGTYNEGTVVTVTVTPSIGYTFTGWSGDISDTSPSVTITMNGDKSIIANFDAQSSVSTIVTPQKLFSPDNRGDATTETWLIENAYLLDGCEIIVYNRQGQKVYSSVGYPSPWNGTLDGRPLPDGAYFYIIRYPNQKKQTGSVTIARLK
jgi:pectate lyase